MAGWLLVGELRPGSVEGSPGVCFAAWQSKSVEGSKQIREVPTNERSRRRAARHALAGAASPVHPDWDPARGARARRNSNGGPFSLARVHGILPAETADRSGAEKIRSVDYNTVAQNSQHLGLGDWIFGVPPFGHAPDLDNHYIAYLRREQFPERDIAKVIAMRALVPAFLEQCLEDVLASAPRVVGFTTTFSQTVPSLVLARMLKQRDPSLAIVFGGANCDGPMGAALHREFPWVDVVVRGEAEHILPGLVKDLFAGGPVRPQPRLCYRDGEGPVAVPPD